VTALSPGEPRPDDLPGQTVVVIGGSSGIGLETARRARAEGADVVLTGRDPARLGRAGKELGALRTAAFDATDPDQLERFFGDLADPVDHVMVTAGGSYYSPLAEIDFAKVRRSFDEHLPADVAALAVHLMTNTALTGATYDVDGGEQLVSEHDQGPSPGCQPAGGRGRNTNCRDSASSRCRRLSELTASNTLGETSR